MKTAGAVARVRPQEHREGCQLVALVAQAVMMPGRVSAGHPSRIGRRPAAAGVGRHPGAFAAALLGQVLVVFERDHHLGTELGNLVVLEVQIHLDDLGHPDVL